MLTGNAPTRFGIVLTLAVWVAGCTQSPKIPVGTGIEVERELCIQWRDSLPSRSRADTARTQQEIGYAYDVQGMACPAWARFPA